MARKPHTVAVVSGGLDSVTMAHMLADDGHDLTIFTADYGQRHVREVAAAKACADRLGAEHVVADLTALRPLLAGSALTSDDVEVPEGHYAEPSMRSTVVPNRNAILLSVACGLAVSRGAGLVATAVHAGDHYVYPDCRPAFVAAMDDAMATGTEGFGPAGGSVRLVAPFVYVDKTEVARIAGRLGVPIDATWSCYQGGAVHCGRCGTCVERIEALTDAGVPDPTEYEAAAA